eukprot:CCRYP_015220-RB/>CCRYP_015220-RB protein AED:0.24 eAED:0.24 QI:2374/1/0.87/1/0/0/8/0/1034
MNAQDNQFRVSNIISNVLNLGCQCPHSHDGVAKFLSYLTGEQFQHVPNKTTGEINSRSTASPETLPTKRKRLPTHPIGQISPIPWDTSTVARTLGLTAKSEFNVTKSSPSLYSHRKGTVDCGTIQQSQITTAQSPSYFGAKTSVLETPQPLQLFCGPVQSPSTLDRSWLVDPSSPTSIDSKTFAGNALLELKNSHCKHSTMQSQNPVYSQFYENYVSPLERDHLMNTSNSIDLFAWANKDVYPEGNVTFVVNETPSFGWAFQNRSSGGTKVKSLHCLGVFVCPVSSCPHRIRPKHPIRKKGHQGSVPDPHPDSYCQEHLATPIYISCKCRCRVKDNQDGTWTVSHSGSHNHPAPNPVRATRKGLTKLTELLQVNPKMSSIDILKGNDVREGIAKSDLKLGCPDYLKHLKRKIVRQLSTQITGVSYTYDAPDMFLESLRRIQQNFPDVIKNSSMGGKDSVTFISLQTTEMARRSVDVSNSKQVDTIMSLSNTLYYQGNLWVTTTSTWDIHLQKQVPCIVTIHTGMSANDYSAHFDSDHQNFEQFKIQVSGDLFQLLMLYPGHTMDMSGALFNGWLQSFTEMCDRVFRIDEIPSSAVHAILRLCTVHFKNNVRRVSRISMCVTPQKASRFRKMCGQLLEDISFDEFEDIVTLIQSEFPKCRGWLAWYLNQRRAPHLFPACNTSQSNPLTKDRFHSLCQDTNAQEGFGSLLKKWTGKHETFESLLMNLIQFVKRFDSAMRLQRAGLNQFYGRATRANKKRHGKKEPKSNYKAPDTYRDVTMSNKRGRNKRRNTISDKHKVKTSTESENEIVRKRDGHALKATHQSFVRTKSGRISKRPIRDDFVRWSSDFQRKDSLMDNESSTTVLSSIVDGLKPTSCLQDAEGDDGTYSCNGNKNSFSSIAGSSDDVSSMSRTDYGNFDEIDSNVLEDVQRMLHSKDANPFVQSSVFSKSCKVVDVNLEPSQDERHTSNKIPTLKTKKGHLSILSRAPPVQLKNKHNSCFASTLVQNIMSSGPMRCAIMNSSLINAPNMKFGYNNI